MAQKALESAVRELTKTVTDLTSKCESLNGTVTELKVIVSKLEHKIEVQTQEIAGFKTIVGGSPQLISPKATVASPPTPPAPRRLVRRARMLGAPNTAGTVSNTPKVLYATVTKKVCTSSTKPSQASDASRPEQTASPLGKKINNLTATSLPLITEEKVQPDSKNGWEEVRGKRTYKKRPILTGSGKIDEELQTVERLRYIQAWSFKPDTDTQNILKFLNKTHRSEGYFVQKRDLKTNRHAAFVIGLPESLYDLFNSPTSWPQGVRVSNWTFREGGARGDITARARAVAASDCRATATVGSDGGSAGAK